MVMKHVARKALCKFSTPVLDQKTPRFLDQLDHWLENKGVEWVSERWKVIRNAAHLVRSGKPEDAVKAMSDAGISVRKDHPISRGPFGLIQKAYIDAETPYRLRSCDALLRGYTGLFLSVESKKQVTKARDGITKPSSAIPDFSLSITKTVEKVSGHRPRSIPQDYSPDMRGMSGIRTYYSAGIRIPRKLREEPFASAVVSSLTTGAVPDSVIRLLGDNPIRQRASGFQKYGAYPDTYGKISFLQEGGCKARVICLPSFWMQAYYKPLQDELIRRVVMEETDWSQKRLGISCVYDQNKGAYALQKWMDEKKELYSFDLSSATDRFPLDPQLGYLRGSGLESWVNPVHDAARGKYFVPSNGEVWSYSVGQPMGLNFSFPLFHLTHLAIIEAWANITSKDKPKPVYAVLGDDVIIADKELAKVYKEVITRIGVDISETKSLVSKNLQSFAGFSGVSTTHGIQVFRPFKHSCDFSLKGKEVNLLATLGPKVRKWSGWWSRSFDQLHRTYPLRNPDLSPILTGPEWSKGMTPGSRWLSSITNRVLDETLVQFGPGRIAGQPFRREISLRFSYTAMGDWNREWSNLLREKESLLTSTFDRDQYITEEKRKVRTNQVSNDPLIRDQKILDRVRESFHGTTTGRNVVTKSSSF